MQEARSAVDAVCVTGSSGFIGRHLCAALANAKTAVTGIDRVPGPRTNETSRWLQLDIQLLEDLQRKISDTERNGKLVHLAAEAEVVTPWNQIPSLLSTNLNGTWNVLATLQPTLCVFASSSSVYGNATIQNSAARWSAARPLGLYGISKSSGELLLRDWALDNGTAAVLLRLGNIIGPGCRGLIPYLIRHAKQYPDGATPAQLRGNGVLVRDYTPVSYVVKVIQAVLSMTWPPGSSELFNLGTGGGMTNREVTKIVQRVLAREGYRLTVCWDNPVPAGEAHSIVLDCGSLIRKFGIGSPSRKEVEACIEDSALEHLRS